MTIRNAGSFLSLVAVVVIASMLVGCGPNIAEMSRKLKDPDPTVRWDAAEALGKSKSPSAVSPLIEALADEDIAVQNAAAEALGKLGKVAVQPLSNLLGDVEPTMRRLAAFALGQSACPAAVAPLAEAIKTDQDPGVRIEMAVALGTIGGPDAQGALEAAAVDDKDAKVKEAAINALNALKAGG